MNWYLRFERKNFLFSCKTMHRFWWNLVSYMHLNWVSNEICMTYFHLIMLTRFLVVMLHAYIQCITMITTFMSLHTFLDFFSKTDARICFKFCMDIFHHAKNKHGQFYWCIYVKHLKEQHQGSLILNKLFYNKILWFSVMTTVPLCTFIWLLKAILNLIDWLINPL